MIKVGKIALKSQSYKIKTAVMPSIEWRGYFQWDQHRSLHFLDIFAQHKQKGDWILLVPLVDQCLYSFTQFLISLSISLLLTTILGDCALCDLFLLLACTLDNDYRLHRMSNLAILEIGYFYTLWWVWSLEVWTGTDVRIWLVNFWKWLHRHCLLYVWLVCWFG